MPQPSPTFEPLPRHVQFAIGERHDGQVIALRATGSLVYAGNVSDADTVELFDGVHVATVFEYDTAAAATGTLVLAGQPDDADAWTLDDGVNPAVTFEFDSDASVTETTTLRQVVIGVDVATTLLNLQAAINAAPVLEITAGAPTGGDTVPLTNDNIGTAGNQAVVETTNVSTNLSSTGMSGGDDLAAAGSNVPVAIGVDAEASLDNLVQAINDVAGLLTITATKSDATTLALVADFPGTLGNQPIVNNLTNVTETGMSGGTDEGGVLPIGIVVRGSDVPRPLDSPATAPSVLLCLARNLGDAAFTLAVTESANNGLAAVPGQPATADAYAARSIRVAGADVVGGTLAVEPGGAAVFLVEWAFDDDDYIKFAVDDETAFGELSIAHYGGTLTTRDREMVP